MARSSVLGEATHVEPSPADQDHAAAISRASAGVSEATLRLPSGEEITLPASLVAVLQASADQLSQGHGITVLATAVRLTPAEVGELLGLSRPFVARLLDAGDSPQNICPRRHGGALGGGAEVSSSPGTPSGRPPTRRRRGPCCGPSLLSRRQNRWPESSSTPTLLFPFSVMDLMLALTEDSVHEVLWTQALLAEWERVIVPEQRRSAASAAAITAAIREYFPENEVPEPTYAHLIDQMPGKDPDDRVHMAAAIAGGAKVIVTWNQPDFPAEALAAYGVQGASARRVSVRPARRLARRGFQHRRPAGRRETPSADDTTRLGEPARAGWRSDVRASATDEAGRPRVTTSRPRSTGPTTSGRPLSLPAKVW